MLHLCGLIQDSGWTKLLVCFVMMFDNGEAQWEELVVEFNEGANDGRSKKGHLAKAKYLDFLEEILDPSKWIDVCMFGQFWEECLHV